MLDFSAVHANTQTVGTLVADLTPTHLRQLTNEMIDTMLAMIADCQDADVTFTPSDPTAYDPEAAQQEELTIAWTLGHVIVHTTASSEEAGAIAAELARGIPHRGGRSRSEIPWQTITTLAQCRARLEESRRMRLASLDMWPDKPSLETTFTIHEGGEAFHAISCFTFGLMHDDSHIAQIADIVRQAHATRA